MKGTILLNYSENTRQVEEEEKTRFLRSFLEQCFESAPEVSSQIVEILGLDEAILSVQQKIKLRNILTTYGIQVIDNLDGHMKIYLENELMAEWYKCQYKLKKDPQVLDPKKRIYLEMEVNCWSVFDPQEDPKEQEN